MQIRHITPSAQIYIDQINNYISTGQGYKQLRILLLKQLNSIDQNNHSSDQTLPPALMQNLRRKLMEDSSQEKSRTIDVLEDIIKYADDIVESYVTSEMYCITFQTVITYKLFNPFSKAIFDENRQRLLSIIMHYYSKFQANPNRYLHMFKIYKQLKQRGYQFPNKSYIIYPKINQFKPTPKLTKKQSSKSSQSDKIGVTFDSIIEFVNDCQHQFNNNKNSCANTQFVRALKVKAKTLFDLSQNTQGYDLSVKQKQHAKQLYKQIRTMLKQIQKISEQKIKQQRIKSEKEFTQQKIEHMTPKKKQKQFISGGKRQSQQNTGNLLDQPIVETVVSNVKTPSMKKVSLLDDNNENQDFTQFVTSNAPQALSIKKSVSSHSKSQLPLSQGPKPLKKPPKYDDTPKTTKIEKDNLIETVQPKTIITPKKDISQQQQQVVQLIETVQIKSVHSKKSLNSEQSDKIVNLIEQPQVYTTTSPYKSDHNVIDFQNQQHFCRFQVVNTLTSKIMDPNAYNVIPHDIDFSDSSSQSGNRVTFQVNKNQAFFDEQHNNKPYDRGYLTPKKQSSQHQRVSQQVARSQQDLQKMSLSANYQQKSELVPNYDFGILADTRQVKAYDYTNVHNVNFERSMSNVSQEEERKINLTPQSIKKPREAMSMKELSPNEMQFNSHQKKDSHQQVTNQDDQQQFSDYYNYQVQQQNETNQIKKQSLLDKLVSKLQQNDEQILVEHSPQKGKLVIDNNINESPISNNQPLL